MNQKITSRSLGILAGAVASVLIALALPGCVTAQPPALQIANPYAGVDWAKDGQYKANFHTHTTMSDGSGAPEVVIDRYHELGYKILALTDHDDGGPEKPTWPWQAYERDPEKLGMVAVQGNEISRKHHMGSLFNDYGNANLKTEDEALEAIGSRGGLAVFFHPGRYKKSADWYADLFRRFPCAIGMEVYNQGDKYPDDRKAWDAVLAKLPAERPVWGFSDDDMHSIKAHLGRNWNVLIMPALSPGQVRLALEQGRFFFVYAPKGHAGPAPPAIAAIVVDERAGTIRIKAAGQESVEWISQGKVVGRGEALDLARTPGAVGYVRAELRGAGGAVVGTQPFRLWRASPAAQENIEHPTPNVQH